jgi:hypothetical protein
VFCLPVAVTRCTHKLYARIVFEPAHHRVHPKTRKRLNLRVCARVTDLKCQDGSVRDFGTTLPAPVHYLKH